MAQEGDSTLGGLEVSTTPGSYGVGAILVEEEGGEGEEKFEVVGARCVFEDVFDYLSDSHLVGGVCEGRRGWAR